MWRALRVRNSGLVGLKADPLIDPLRNESRFQAIRCDTKFRRFVLSG
jgi:hypothetical protein